MGGSPFSSAMDATMRVWDTESGLAVRVIKDRVLRRLDSLSLSADGRVAVTIHGDTFIVWDIGRGTRRRALKHRALKSSDWKDLSQIKRAIGDFFRLSPAGPPIQALLSSDGRTVATIQPTYKWQPEDWLKLWDTDKGVETDRLSIRDEHLIAISSDGTNYLLAEGLRTGDESHGTLEKLYICREGHKTSRKTAYRNAYFDLLAFHFKSNQIISSLNSEIRYWNLVNDSPFSDFYWRYNSSSEYIIGRHSKKIHSLALSANGERALSASVDDAISVWDLTYRKEQHRLAARAAATVLEVSPNGFIALSGSTSEFDLYDL